MIKKHRLSNGWTQEQLAQHTGLSVRTIQRIERGQPAGLESLKCLAAVFNMSVSQLQNDMAKQENELFLGADPILPVKSVNDTADFYEAKLGFEIEILWQDPPYAVVARGQTIIEFGETRKAHAGSGVCVIFVSDADVVYQEYSNKGIEFLGEIADRDYGSRDFRIKDNNGNVLIISSPLLNQHALLKAGNAISQTD